MKRSQMGKKSPFLVADALCEALKVTGQKVLVLEALIDVHIHGIRLAAEVAKDYDKYSYHGYLVSDCILGKLNVVGRRPRKNREAAKIQKALDDLERKVDGLAGTQRFMALSAKKK
jgi:hypothetical protein